MKNQGLFRISNSRRCLFFSFNNFLSTQQQHSDTQPMAKASYWYKTILTKFLSFSVEFINPSHFLSQSISSYFSCEESSWANNAERQREGEYIGLARKFCLGFSPLGQIQINFLANSIRRSQLREMENEMEYKEEERRWDGEWRAQRVRREMGLQAPKGRACLLLVCISGAWHRPRGGEENGSRTGS